ncbi:general stress protein [Acidicapsa ligni]|uniref:general stress protein n=1 Tax=Acidicapsa ligni TaxID=542300 RepID=UPI0021E0ABE6|nr:general stress protein [Acidicapsa ligni]
MTGKMTAVFGIYPNTITAESAVDRLVASGFPNEDVSVLMSDVDSTRDFAHEKATKAPEGTAVGVTTGGVVGGTLGLLAGIGALAIPGIGPLVAAGPIMGALAGLGVGGAVGGLVGALVGMGIPEYEAKLYEGRVKDGGILLSVHCDTSDEIKRAKDILNETGAEDIASSAEAPAAKNELGNEREYVATTDKVH